MADMNFKFVALNLDAAQRNINRLTKIGDVTKKLAHETAVGILMHKIEHGDHTKMINLVDAIKSGMGSSQSKAFIEWVMAFTNLVYVAETSNGKGKDKVIVPHSFKVDRKKTDKLKDAQAKPFWKLERKVPQAPIDIQSIVMGALQRAAAGQIKEGQEAFFEKLVEATGFEPKRELSKEEKTIASLEAKLAKLKAGNAERETANA